ncbi:MAG: penicillin-binding protein 2 [Pseudomonadota bacterium]
MTDTPHDDGARGRIILIILVFVAIYGVLGTRLVTLGLTPAAAVAGPAPSPLDDIQAARPDIIDRNGEVLATDLVRASLYAEPRNILDVDEAVEKLTTVLPEFDPRSLRRDLSSDRGFTWLKREISAAQRERVHDLGIPGLGFLSETRRFYPGGSSVGHIVGHVNIDNAGIAGLEKTIDGQGLQALQSLGLARKGQSMAPVELTIDLRVQHAVRDELLRAKARYKAKAAVGIVLNAKTMEVVAMSSLPDYDPNRPAQSLDEKRMNRAMTGVFELGSIMKTFTLAMALDSGVANLNDRVDARTPLVIGKHRIRDFHAKNRILTVSEVFKYSSNIGTARLAMLVGQERQRAYLKRLGMMNRMPSELPEGARPLVPQRWPKVTVATVSFGHGMSVTPMHAAVAGAAVLNGGVIAPPTFYPRSEAEMANVATRVISPRVSAMVRDLFALNAAEGSGRRARVPGYRVGGKTGTAEKVVRGVYADDKRLNSFLAAFPMDDPQFVTLVVIDEPQPAEGEEFATAGWNAAPTTANIISRIAPMLSVRPHFDDGVGQLAELGTR